MSNPGRSVSNDGDHSDDSLQAPITSDVASTTEDAFGEELAESTPLMEASMPISLVDDVKISPGQQLNGFERKRKANREVVESPEEELSEEPRPKRKRGRPRQFPTILHFQVLILTLYDVGLQPQSSPEGSTITSGEEWEVEEIIDSRIEAGTLVHYYEVKWRGFSSKHNTWEPKVHLQNCKEAIEEFERGQQRSRRR